MTGRRRENPQRGRGYRSGDERSFFPVQQRIQLRRGWKQAVDAVFVSFGLFAGQRLLPGIGAGSPPGGGQGVRGLPAPCPLRPPTPPWAAITDGRVFPFRPPLFPFLSRVIWPSPSRCPSQSAGRASGRRRSCRPHGAAISSAPRRAYDNKQDVGICIGAKEHPIQKRGKKGGPLLIHRNDWQKVRKAVTGGYTEKRGFPCFLLVHFQFETLNGSSRRAWRFTGGPAVWAGPAGKLFPVILPARFFAGWMGGAGGRKGAFLQKSPLPSPRNKKGPPRREGRRGGRCIRAMILIRRGSWWGLPSP